MLDLFFSSAYAPFTAALLVLAGIAVIELFGMLTSGVGLSDLLDLVLDFKRLPDRSLIKWLHLKELPLSAVTMLLLGLFGLSGFVLQLVLSSLQGQPAPGWIAGLMAGLVSLHLTHWLGGLMLPLFKGSSTAVSEMALIGRTGVLLSPRAARGYAGEVKVLDEHGQTHYFMVEPLHDSDELPQGAQLRLVAKQDSLFLAQRVDR